MNRVLVLGAGLVAKPLVDYLASFDDIELTVTDLVAAKAAAITNRHRNATAMEIDGTDDMTLAGLVASHDITVSLLPAPMHARIAGICLEHGKNLTTTSYISPQMAALHDKAKAAGLVFLNECGVDPGIDHMSAMRVIHGVQDRGGKIVSFRSYCGGLPAPEANDNPIGYKFSWAPRGVLTAATNPARHLKNGEIIDVPGNQLFHSPEILNFPGIGDLEGYPNRDAIPYIEMYRLEDVETMFRGTLRNLGHCESWRYWVDMGLFEANERSDLNGLTYKRFMQGFVEGAGNINRALSLKWNIPEDAPAIANLDWLGMFHESSISVTKGGNVDILASRLSEKCRYKERERDMIVMKHEFVARFDDGDKKIESVLIDYGQPGGDTSMSRTVSLPLAIATRLLLEGRITERGVLAPVSREWYVPILATLEKMNITCIEREV